MPRLPFDKFIKASRKLTTQMKATGEVMSICTNFEGALMKALRSLEQHVDSLIYENYNDLPTEEIHEMLHRVDDRRIFVIAEALRRGISAEEIHDITKVDIWFIDKINNIVQEEKLLRETPEITKEMMQEAKRMEFPDKVIAQITGKKEKEIKELRYGFVAHLHKAREIGSRELLNDGGYHRRQVADHCYDRKHFRCPPFDDFIIAPPMAAINRQISGFTQPHELTGN